MITAYPTQMLTGSGVNAIVAEEIRRQEIARKAELVCLRAELGVRRNRDSRYYRQRIDDAQRMYGDNRPVGRIRRTLLSAVGLIMLICDGGRKS